MTMNGLSMLKRGSLPICLASVILWGVIPGLADGLQDPSAQQNERPKFYSPTWPQFKVEGCLDPRVVSIMRSGAGRHRRAEYTVFEVVEDGRRLRHRARTVIDNERRPRGWIVVDGRFLLILDDRWKGFGRSHKCLVIHDLERGVSASWGVADMLPESVAESLQYWSSDDYVDPVRRMYYPSSPASCLRHGYPFLTVDLPSLSVKYLPEPLDRLPTEVVDNIRSRVAMTWTWSMGRSKIEEPNWHIASALPALLKGLVRKPEIMGPLGVTEEAVYFKYDAASGDYLRCDAQAWADPPEIWGQREPDRTDSGK